MAKGVLVFSSVYSLNVWDVRILHKNKKNMHSCGAYTAISINNLTKKAMRKEFKELALPVLKDSVESCLKVITLIEENEQLIDALFSEVCMSKDALFDLAKNTNNKLDWPIRVNVHYEKSPLNILFSKAFQLFDRQCLYIDALARTGWIENKKAHAIHKRLCKPLRTFMQDLSVVVKALQK